MSLKSLIFACLAAFCASAAPLNAADVKALQAKDVPNTSGPYDPYFQTFWTDTVNSVNYTNLAGGAFSVIWENSGSWIAGKGWKVGSLTRKIAYNAQYQNTAGHSYLSVYGWTRFPVIEYYIVENFDGPQSPHQAAVKMGSVTTDGGTYDILRAVRVNAQPAVEPGIKSFYQYWSVRREKRSSGTVNIDTHFKAWAQVGMTLGGQQEYQIFAVEGYRGSGSAHVHVSET